MSHEELAKELERQEKEAEEQAEREVAALKMQNAARVKAAKAEPKAHAPPAKIS